MLSMKHLRSTTLAFALAAAGLTGTDAAAGSCGYGGYGGYGVSISYGRHGYTYRSSRHDHHPRRSHHRDRVTVRRHEGHRQADACVEPAGYYRRVYQPPVYRTYYDACGYPYRVKVRAGYYERVWVEGRRRH